VSVAARALATFVLVGVLPLVWLVVPDDPRYEGGARVEMTWVGERPAGAWFELCDVSTGDCRAIEPAGYDFKTRTWRALLVGRDAVAAQLGLIRLRTCTRDGCSAETGGAAPIEPHIDVVPRHRSA
jgi:hypothetical protein